MIQLRCIRYIHNTTQQNIQSIYSSAHFRMFVCSMLSLTSKNHAYLLNRFSTVKTRTIHVLWRSEKQFKSSLAINKSIRWILMFQYCVCSRTHTAFALLPLLLLLGCWCYLVLFIYLSTWQFRSLVVLFFPFSLHLQNTNKSYLFHLFIIICFNVIYGILKPIRYILKLRF